MSWLFGRLSRNFQASTQDKTSHVTGDDEWESWKPDMLVDIMQGHSIASPESQPKTNGAHSITSQEQTQPDDSPRRRCIVCFEEHTYNRFPKQLITDACTHIPNVCRDCLQTYISAEMKHKVWHDKLVKCPEPECRATLDYADIQAHADHETLIRHTQLLDEQLFSNMETFFRCPAEGCGSGQEHVSGEAFQIVTCVKCKERFCFHHRVRWSEHQGMSCAEFDAFLADPDHFRSQLQLTNEAVEKEKAMEKKRRLQQEEQDLAFAQTLVVEEQRAQAARQADLERRRREERQRQERAAEQERRRAEELERQAIAQEIRRKKADESANLQKINQTTKRCPSCKWPIEKNGGCSHMTCRCGRKFNW